MILSINKQRSAFPVMRELETRLAKAGHRLTSPRKVVLRQVAAQGTPFTASDLLAGVANIAPEVGRATVFRTLDLLVELGVLQRVHIEQSGNWAHSYMLCGLNDAHHHHLVCTGCGRITDFAGCFLDTALLKHVQATARFQVEAHHLELYGQCATCQGS
jgi:Fur family transcriptional regulator, ferric uptake regulator